MVTFEPTEDYSELIPRGEKVRERKPADVKDQFVPVSFNRINDMEWRIKYRSPLTGYLYIRSQIVRASYAGDDYDLFNRYFRDNKFAAAPSYRHLSNAFGYKDNTKPIRGWVKQLFKEGAFLIEKIDVPGKPEPANVYILGYNEQGKQVYYYDI